MAMFGRSFLAKSPGVALSSMTRPDALHAPDAVKLEDTPSIGATPVGQARQGMFGKSFRTRLPEYLNIIGATMRQVGGDDPALDRLLYQQRLDAEAQEEREAGKREHLETENALSTLPEHLRPFARLAPSAALAAHLAAQQGDWQTGAGYTNAFRIRPDGTRELGAPLPLRPRAGQQAGPSLGDDWEEF